MTQKQQNQTDFTDKDEVKLLILVNEQAHTNWMSGLPLIKGNEGYAFTHPEDWGRLTKAYEKMNKVMGNPPLNKGDGSRCCGGGCGCHGE